MESLFYRYRNITALLVALFAQLIFLAWQVKNENNVPFIRFWAITAVTPVASAIENTRNATTGFFGSYFALRDARQQSRKLRSEVDRLALENQLLRNELASAQRVASLAGFQAHTPSKMIGARVIGATTGAGTKSLLIDRGTSSGVQKGMAVVTPAGIVGRILAVYPFASQVLSVNDAGFAAGVESQKNHVHGVLKGVGTGFAKMDYVPGGQKLEVGELLFTSGEDRVFPKGLLVGKITGVAEGENFQSISVQPSGAEAAAEEVLVIVDPSHQEIPEAVATDTAVFLAPPVKPETPPPGPETKNLSPAGTQADKLMDQYRKLGESQKYTYGEGGPGSLPMNFNVKVPGVNAPAAPAVPPGANPPAANSPASNPPGANAPAAKPPAAAAPGSAAPRLVAPGSVAPGSATSAKPKPAAPLTAAPQTGPASAGPAKPAPRP
jgi:rod shape-determining protein MreC